MPPLCHDDERSALLQFKESRISNDFYASKFDCRPTMASWKPEEGNVDCCSWDGVHCNKNTGHVIKLDLSHSCLFGSINSSSSLSKFFGELPISMGNLGSLKELDLSQNGYFGQITSSLRNLSQLFFLDLAQNSYRGTIDSNNLQGPFPVPPPGTIHYLASNNNLTGEIPSWICNLNILESLVLSHNNLSGLLPQCLGNFSNELSVLDLQGNNFFGTVPNTFIKESRLGVIDLSHNLFQGRIPRSLINCSKLEFLGLGNNQISDTFPSWLGTLPNLNVLILRSNIFYGIIKEPRTDCGFSKLRIIDLSNNRFTGTLPSKSFLCWNAMKIVNTSELRYLQDVLSLNYRMDSGEVGNAAKGNKEEEET
ncbi:hypothetical protein CUMW_259950 [Citrus unshiu]|uniref:Leucine-rich repeat-containing N-terminal plant-type domain-containing protein n=1 Tax=Citrus unshiu TaxID=55188 RepID=A0A2H5QTC9_CITUN|nr:hypothetical protein CUMW_259950 [Citrus unshiu]